MKNSEAGLHAVQRSHDDAPEGMILGVKVNAVSMSDTLSLISKWIYSRTPHYVCCVPAHSIMECVDAPGLRRVFNRSNLCTPDGMAIVWLLKAKGYSQVERVYGPDLLLETCREGLKYGWRHFFYGGKPGTGEKLAGIMQQKYPGIQIAGWNSPPFRQLLADEEVTFKGIISRAKPDILWVALGSPRQERWMAQWVNEIDVPVLIGVGAAFDFLTGQKAQAPKWIQKSGFEWFFRLVNEPGRLWKRYVINYPRFAALIILEKLGIKTIRE